MFYAFTLTNPNPDFLVAVILLFYVRRVLSEDYGKSDKDGLCCGSLGALAYFAKAYAFPFFHSAFYPHEPLPILRRRGACVEEEDMAFFRSGC